MAPNGYEGESVPLLSASSQTRADKYGYRRTQFACAAVLIAETFERVAFYTVAGNLVMFLNVKPMSWESYNAAQALFLFTGFSFVTSVFGGWLADSCLGKFKGIVFFFLIYMAGFAFLPALYPYPDPKYMFMTWGVNGTSPDPDRLKWCGYNDTNTNNTNSTTLSGRSVTLNCEWAVYLCLGLLSLGVGGIKANIAPFGADQVKNHGPVVTRRFFTWFYWCINIGSILALGGIAWVQQVISFFYGFIAGAGCLVLAFVVFLIGRCWYVVRPPTGSVLTNVFRIFCEACSNKRRRKKEVEIFDSVEQVPEPGPPSCLDYAQVRYGGSFHENIIEDVKTLGKIICIFLSLIPYWIGYYQMETTYVLQGLHMRFANNETSPPPSLIGPANTTGAPPMNTFQFQIAVSWLSLFDILFILMLLPILDRLVYPMLEKRGLYLTQRVRICVGIFCNILSVIIAGVVEMIRLNTYWGKDGCTEHKWVQKIGGTEFDAADLSIFLQVPQYALIGIGEAFASVAGLELAYSQSPRSMQGIIMGLYWFTSGVGSVLGTIIIVMFHGYFFFGNDRGNINYRDCKIPGNITNSNNPVCECTDVAHLDYYFFVLAGIQVAGMGIFVLAAWKLNIGGKPFLTRKQGSYGKKNEPPIGSSSAPRVEIRDASSVYDSETNRGNTHVQRQSSNSSADSRNISRRK